MLNEMISHEYKRVPIEDIEDSHSKNSIKAAEGENTSVITTDDTSNHAIINDENEESFDAHIFLLEIGKNKKRIGINSEWRVLQIKQKYFQSELVMGCNIRLIYRGKLLDDYKCLLSDYQISDGCFVHVSIANNIGYQSQILKEKEFTKHESNNTNGNEVFDDGLNDAEIALRMQTAENRIFHNRSRIPIANNNELNTDLESIDIQNTGNGWWNENNGSGNNNNNNNSANNSSSTITNRRDFICGFFLGLMVGVWVYFILLFVRRSYSRRFRLGVLTGVMLNIMIEIFNHQTNHHPNDDDTNDSSSTSTNTNVNNVLASDTNINANE